MVRGGRESELGAVLGGVGQKSGGKLTGCVCLMMGVPELVAMGHQGRLSWG